MNSKPINLDNLDDTRGLMSQGKDSTASNMGGGIQESDMQNQIIDEDAAVYRRAKQSVDELHRARKFEKSIKLK